MIIMMICTECFHGKENHHKNWLNENEWMNETCKCTILKDIFMDFETFCFVFFVWSMNREYGKKEK